MLAKKKVTHSHSELVKIAVRYLRGTVGCHAVIAELRMNNYSTSLEVPDAIGWIFNSSSVLVECKASRADFHADKLKIFRKIEKQGLGRHRYFMAPQGMLKPEEMPNGWGLLEVDAAKRVHRKSQSTNFMERNLRHEIAMLTGALRRVEIRLPLPLNEFIGPVFDPYRKNKTPLIFEDYYPPAESN